MKKKKAVPAAGAAKGVGSARSAAQSVAPKKKKKGGFSAAPLIGKVRHLLPPSLDLLPPAQPRAVAPVADGGDSDEDAPPEEVANVTVKSAAIAEAQLAQPWWLDPLNRELLEAVRKQDDATRQKRKNEERVDKDGFTLERQESDVLKSKQAAAPPKLAPTSGRVSAEDFLAHEMLGRKRKRVRGDRYDRNCLGANTKGAHYSKALSGKMTRNDENSMGGHPLLPPSLAELALKFSSR
eukprot:CAMPEP_0117535398 /NCGR_PEP_ID=MMETSP0784-20121206/40914_1 /TAXON_ID=39447 /ORGANISM="" /LENGTH=237 /DNA_ID=CAMNT_0005331923 /DNA_START=16 /DNA_END=730 /DNA_ORIENTATION=+